MRPAVGAIVLAAGQSSRMGANKIFLVLEGESLLRRMVVSGLHGRKSGRGFYDYASDPPTPIDLAL